MKRDLRKAIEAAAGTLKELGAREVYVFGSAAGGTMREESDVDLALSGPPPEIKKIFEDFQHLALAI